MKTLLVLFVLLSTIGIFAQNNQKFINVNGTSELTLTADQVDFTVRIKIVDNSIEASKKLNDEALNSLLKILNNMGINSTDIVVTPITLGKNYVYLIDNPERQQKGFFSEVNVSFVLKDLSKYAELTNRLSTNDSFEIIAANYSLSDYETQHQAAYEKALSAAKQKAAYMAKTLNLKLGSVLEVDEVIPGFPMPMNTYVKEDAQSGGVTGRVVISRTIRVKFEIL